MRRPSRGESGQASLELLGALPLLLLGCFAALQVAFAVITIQADGSAARAAARARSHGEDPLRAARAAVPSWMRDGLRLTVPEDARAALQVRSRIPVLLPVRGFPHGPTVDRSAWFPSDELTWSG